MQLIQRYEDITGTLARPHSYKVRKILEHNCLRKVGKDTWNCLPIAGYNVTTYRLTKMPSGSYSCSCQGHKKRGACSHSAALHALLFFDAGQQEFDFVIG